VITKATEIAPARVHLKSGIQSCARCSSQTELGKFRSAANPTILDEVGYSSLTRFHHSGNNRHSVRMIASSVCRLYELAAGSKKDWGVAAGLSGLTGRLELEGSLLNMEGFVRYNQRGCRLGSPSGTSS
jgi:hypothetical protein